VPRGARRGRDVSDVELPRRRPGCLPESKRPPRDDREPRGQRGVPRGRPGLRRRGAVPKTQGGAPAPRDADVGATADPAAGADASLAASAAAEEPDPLDMDLPPKGS